MQPYRLIHHKLLFPGVLVEYSLDGTVRIGRRGTDLSPDPTSGVLTREIVRVFRTYPPGRFAAADELLQTLEASGFVTTKSWLVQNQEKDLWFETYAPLLKGLLYSETTIRVEMTCMTHRSSY